MHPSSAAGPVPDSHCGALGARQWLGVLLLVAAMAAPAAVARAGKVQEIGPPIKVMSCQRCSVQQAFTEKIRVADPKMDFVELKNGVGIVYLTDDPEAVPRIQKAVAWARDELQRIADHPEEYRLCSYCKATAPVFSEIEREVVLTAQGAMFLMRSEDPDAIKALKDLMNKARKRETGKAPAPSR